MAQLESNSWLRLQPGVRVPEIPSEGLKVVAGLAGDDTTGDPLVVAPVSPTGIEADEWDRSPENPYAAAGDPEVFAWPATGDELPAIYFALAEEVDDRCWLIRGELVPDLKSGLLRLARVTVEPLGHDGEVSGSVLRGLQVARIRDRAIQKVRAMGTRPIHFGSSFDSEPDFPFETPIFAAHIDAEVAPRKKGRKGLGDAHYRKIAMLYLEIYNQGVTKGILKAIAARLDEEHADAGTVTRPKTSPATVRDWVNRARELEFLSEGKSGRAGAAPGSRLAEATSQQSPAQALEPVPSAWPSDEGLDEYGFPSGHQYPTLPTEKTRGEPRAEKAD
jgi:hypothetical protein